MITLVRFFRRGKPGVLAHRPELTPVHIGLNAARKGKFARQFTCISIRRIHRFNFNSAFGADFIFRFIPGFFHEKELKMKRTIPGAFALLISKNQWLFVSE